VDVRRRHAKIVLEDHPRPHVGGELILGHADLLALEVLRLLDAVGAYIDRGVAERLRHEGGDADIGTVAERGLDGEARQRQLADVEIGRAEGAEEYLLRRQRHEHGIDAVDANGPVDQRTVAVIVADRDGQIEIGHGGSR
jgi:hypothetical protein